MKCSNLVISFSIVMRSLSLALAFGCTNASAATSLDPKAWEEMRRLPKVTNIVRAEGTSNSRVGTAANDGMTGGNANEHFTGGAGDDALDGGGGDDVLEGEGGSDWLRGGPGNDVLRGGAGNDRYEFSSGSGLDRVEDTVGLNTVMIIDASGRSMSIARQGADYVISFGKSDAIQMSSATFATMRFLSLKTLLSGAEFLQMYGTGVGGSAQAAISAGGRTVLKASPAGGEVEGTPADESLIGGPGEDLLVGGGGNDEFWGGKPSGAMCVGGAGNDVYFLSRDDGRLMIRDEGGINEIRLGAGVEPSEVVLRDLRGALTLLVQGSAQATTQIKEPDRWSLMAMPTRGGRSIQRIVFGSGLVWNEELIQQHVNEPSNRGGQL